MAISENPIEEIKEKLDVVEIIGNYLKLKKTGANYSANCPFHSENKPSFFVSPARQVWKCFGCGEGGSVFDFVMKIEGVEFGDALRILSKKAGVQLKPRDPKVQTRRQRFYEVCELGCQFFEKQLESGKLGKKAKEYLLERGITQESIKKWRIGYSPDTWRGLSDFLVGKGYKREEVVSVGLAVKSEKSKTPYDRFRGRIIFPVFDLQSQVIGFGGRIFKQEEETAKYLNVPQTPLYNKSKILYGLNNAKVDIRKKNQCILAEGYTDVIMSHQEGFDNTVATSGTALTSDHLDILKRYSENLVLAFDMDIAGNTATKRGIDSAQEKGFNIKVIKMPPESDPADIISESSQKWQKLLEKSQSIMEFYFNSAFSAHDKETAEGKKEISRIVLPVIKKIPNKIEQSHWIQRLSKDLKVGEEDVFEELNKIKDSNNRSPDLKEDSSEKNFKNNRKDILEKRVFCLLMKKPECLKVIEEKEKSLFSKTCQNIFQEFEKAKKNGDKNLDEVIKVLQNGNSEGIKDFLTSTSFDSEFEEGELSDIEKEIRVCLYEMRSIDIKKELNKISEEIKFAEEKNDDKEISDLIKKFNELTQQLKNI